MKKKIFHIKLVAMVVLFAVNATAQQPKMITDQKEIEKLRVAVELTPDSPKVHQAYIEALGVDNEVLEKQYQAWIRKYPKASAYPYALGKAYEREESPKAKTYLLQAVKLDPKLTEAWGGLWIDAERWGDFEGGRNYLAKAVESDPSNPNYAFYQASSFHQVDHAKYVRLSLEVAKRFPEHQRGAQALYWLGARSEAVADKVKYYEQLYRSYPPAKFSWSSSGMSSYYDLLLSQNPGRASSLAEELAKEPKLTKEWTNLSLQAKKVVAIHQAFEAKNTTEAKRLLTEVKLPRYFKFNKQIILLKAKAEELAGNYQAAYDSLIVSFAKSPNLIVKEAIEGYGKKLGKDSTQVIGDIWIRLEAIAKGATPFSLKQYFAKGNSSLSDYKGKVVLLTYWFPGCGPCRGEFPHFENVVRKFSKNDLAYLGINIISNQNDYVIPFLKTSGYSFIPLEDVKGRDKGNLDNRNAAPVNFLIDRQGRILFSNFRTDGDNEDELELMIKLLVAHKKV